MTDPAPAEAPKRRSLLRKFLLGLLALVLVVVLAAAGYVGYLWYRVPQDHLDPLRPGSASVVGEGAAPAAGALKAGPFTVTLEADKAALSVADDRGRVVWSSDPGQAFVGASVGDVSWTEKFGYFWARVSRSNRLVDQTITSVSESAGTVQVKGEVRGDDTSAPYTLTLSPVVKSPTVTVLGMDLNLGETSDGKAPTSALITSGRDKDEQVYGFGEQYRALDLSGAVFPVLVQEQGIGRGQQPITFLADITNWGGGNKYTTYGSWPTYVTSANRSFALADVQASGAFGIADLSRSGQVSYESWGPHVSAEATAADSPADLIKARAAGVTRPALSEATLDGAVLGLQGGTERVRGIVSDMQAAGTKVSGVWLQDWTGKRQTSFGSQLWWTWQLDQQQYPGWNQMVADFAAQGIDVLTYVNPFLADAAAKNDPSIRNLYAEAAAKGFLVKDAEGQPYVVQTVGFPVGLMDLTNPAAQDWYAGVIASEVFGVGAKGFMADFGEALPMDAVVAVGTAAEQHNRYPQLWADTVRKACELAGQPDCAAFMRSSYLGTPQANALMWAGDQMVDFAEQDGLASVVLGMNSGGISGAPLWHSDIGGYTSINAVVKNYVRPPNLNARWAELQAFGVWMRTHETNRPQQNQQVYDTPETRAQFARASQIYAALQPYRATVLAEAQADGMPAVRHGWLVYPGTKAATADMQFFLGEHLLMAPVTSNDATSVQVTFPPGTWVHALTGETFQGDQVTVVQAPIGTPAAFVKQGDPVGEQIVAALKAVGQAQ